MLSLLSLSSLLDSASAGDECYIVTDVTNFYSESGGQISDVGSLSNQVREKSSAHAFSLWLLFMLVSNHYCPVPLQFDSP